MPGKRLVCALGITLLLPGQLGAEPRRYRVDVAASKMTVLVGTAGLFSFAGHAHVVAATKLEGEVLADPGQVASSSVQLEVLSAGLRVIDPQGPPGDIPAVQETMAGPRVLDVARFPRIAFGSTSVEGTASGVGAFQLTIAGRLELHGQTQPVVLRSRTTLTEDRLVAAGTASIRGSAFGIPPVSVAGVVKTRDEIEVRFEIVATRQAQ
jgi:polyisoprenoid-binding protein YceI